MAKKLKKAVTKKVAKKASNKSSKKSVSTKVLVSIQKPIDGITHYYGNIEVGIIKFNKPVKVGVEVEIRGATTNFSQKLNSMQYDHKPIEVAPKGKEVGVKLDDKARDGDEVYLLE